MPFEFVQIQSADRTLLVPLYHSPGSLANELFQYFDATRQRLVLGCKTDAEVSIVRTEDVTGDDQ